MPAEVGCDGLRPQEHSSAVNRHITITSEKTLLMNTEEEEEGYEKLPRRMSELAAEVKISSAEECQKQEYYTALLKAVEVSDIRAAYSLLQLHFQKSSNMSNSSCEMHNTTCKNCKRETIADMFTKHGHGMIFKMFTEYIQYKPVYENSTASPLDIAVKAYDVKLLDTFLDCVDLHEKIKTRMVSNAFTYFFRHKFNQIITKRKIAMVRRLLELGADVNGGPSVFPLCEAAKVGSYALVELLCQHGADLNKIDRMFAYPPVSKAPETFWYIPVKLIITHHGKNPPFSPADVAFAHGHTDCARLLLKHGANIDIGSSVRSTIRLKSMKCLNFLFEYFRYETQHYIIENRHDLLKLAVSEANVEIVSQIFDIGFGIAQDACWEKLLAYSRNVEMAKFLIQKGVDINKIITSSGSCTPLSMILTRKISLRSQLKLVQVLLENGASPNIHGNISPLMFAALTVDSTDLLQLLLDHGADINWRDKNGDTALLYSTYQDCKRKAHFHVKCPKENDNASCCFVQERWQRNAEFLMNYAKDEDFLNAQNSDGLTALMQAARHSNVAVVSEMINQGCHVNMTDNKGNTALLYAIDRINNEVCCYMTEGIVACLVNAGCSVNWQNNDGISPLMLAANRCNYKVLKLLLDAGADIDVVSKTDRSKTALSYFKPTPPFSERCIRDCLSEFLLHGACLSYLQADMFHKILLCNNLDKINKYFTDGTGPVSVRSDKYFRYFSHTHSMFDVSPLCTALLSGNISLAHHFIEIMYLTKSDLSSLMYNKVVRADLEDNNQRQCLDLLDEMSSQPASLLRLAFVTVSSAVGTSPGRENRVSMLAIPQTFKDKLLFKSPVSQRKKKSPLDLITPRIQSSFIRIYSVFDLITPRIRSPLYFLPSDLSIVKCINLSFDCKHCQAWDLKLKQQIHCL